MILLVKVNGSERELPPGSTVADLLDRLDLPTDGVAVAVDRRVVPRSEHASHELAPGAEIEVIRAVGGG